MKFFTNVRESFTISGRGLYVSMEPPHADDRIKVGDPVQLRTPDGKVLDTQIAGIEHGKPIKPGKGDFNWALRFSGDIKFDEIPVGTEIWLVRHD